MKKIIRTVTHKDWTFKLVNESYRDDYGSYQSDYVVYARYKKGKWTRSSPEYYSLSQSDAEHSFMPSETKKCPTCGHTTTNLIYETNKKRKKVPAKKRKA